MHSSMCLGLQTVPSLERCCYPVSTVYVFGCRVSLGVFRCGCDLGGHLLSMASGCPHQVTELTPPPVHM